MVGTEAMKVVAEISGNHGGSILVAQELIRQAKWAGADYVKFQCFDPEKLAEKRSKNPEILKLADGRNLLDLYLKTHTPREWFPRLIEWAEGYKIEWFSSVFDPDDVDFLETLDCPRYKISAFEMLDWELIRAVQATGKPIVLSVRPTDNVTILHATNYDGTISTLGLSDHGIHHAFEDLPMVEWHLRLPGVDTPDRDFSLTPDEMRELIREAA
jgi:sialic acid synthase SpsE